jgi:hypothetical protein
MDRGDLVEVELAGGELAERIVWSVAGDVIYVCTAQTYERLSRGENAAQPIGFPLRDVRALA